MTSSLLLLLLLQLLSNHDAACLPTAAERPSRSSRVAIVGAGPAGMHMAYLLRSLGFKNLLVLESSGRVGGRSVTLKVSEADPLPHELGTCYVSSDYRDLRRMAQGIGYDLDEATLPAAVIRESSEPSARQMDLEQFVFGRVRRLDPTLRPNASDEEVKQHILQASQRYIRLRSKLYPAQQPDFLEFPLAQPSSEALAKLNCSALSYLEKNGLLALEPYFLFGMTAMGYGSPSDTSALYGLMWMSEAYLTDLLVPRKESRLGMLRKGFQTFWESARDRLQLAGGVQFRMNSRVVGVSRSGGGGGRPIKIRLLDNSMETVDWLVWTPSAQAVTGGLLDDLTPAEKDVFSRLKSRNPSLDRLLAIRNSELALNSPDFNRSPETPASSTIVAYYLSGYSNSEGSSSDLQTAPEAHDPLASGDTLASITFNYMPRYTIPEIADGVLWRILDQVQGFRRTWFTGHSVSFDSVKSVMKYNKMLLLMAFPELENRLKEI
uniref:Amino_oxidase domain-containing protein n=1 Tax=Macrostomum lignano TaxID=282301 RepID=A0A1I8HFM1_9PLAT